MINGLFAGGKLPEICEKVRVASLILPLNNWLIELVFDNPELYEFVAAVAKGFHPGMHLSSFAEICEPMVGAKESLLKLLGGIKEFDEKARVLAMLGGIPEEIRGVVVEKSIPFMEDIETRHSDFFMSLRTISQSQVIEAMELAVPICHTIKGATRGEIVKEIARIPRDQRKSVLKIVVPFIKDLTCDTWLNSIIKAVTAIPPEQRENVAAHAATLMLKNSESDIGPLFKAIANIPEEERGEVMAQATPLMAGINFLSQRIELLKEISSILRRDRADVVAKAAPLVDEISKKRQGHINLIPKTISGIPKERREKAVAFATPLIMECLKSKGYNFANGLAAILGAVGTIAPAEWAEVLDLATPHLQDLSESEKAALIKALGAIPQRERKRVLEQAAPLLEGVKGGKGAIITAVFSFPQELYLIKDFDTGEERAALLEFTHKHGKNGLTIAAPLYEGITGGHRVLVLKAALKVASLEEFVSFAAPLIKEFDGDGRAQTIAALIPISDWRDVLAKAVLLKTERKSDFYKIIEELSAFPRDQRDAIFDTMSAFLEGTPGLRERASIIKAINKIPHELREGILTYSQSFVAGHKVTAGEKINLLEIMRTIPLKERDDVLAKAASLIKPETTWEDMRALLVAMSHIPADQRENAILESAPLFKQGMAVEIVSTVGEIRCEERADVVAKAIPLMSDLTQVFLFQQRSILSAVAEIDRDQRDDVIALATPLFDDKKNGMERAEILRAINNIRPEERQRVLKEATALFKKIKKRPVGLIAAVGRRPDIVLESDIPNKGLFVDLISRLPELAPEARKLCRVVESNKVDWICKRFDYIPLPDLPAAVRYLTENPEEPVESLFGHLMGEDPNFYTRCCDYLTEKLAALSEHRIQAFYFADLILKAPQDLLIDHSHPLFLEAYSVHATANPSLQNNPKNPYALYCRLKKAAEEPLLPCDNPVIVKCREARNTLSFADLPVIDKKLPRALLNRLKKRPNITAYLNEINFKLAELEAQLFGVNSIVPRLLAAGPAHIIRNDHYYLYSIFKAIEEATPSDQEEMLIKFGFSLQACATGQSDAMALYYNALPVKYRTRKGLEGEMERVRSLISASVQHQLHRILSEESLLKEILFVNPVEQVSHQVLYLKNRLCRQMGLEHEVVLDPGSGTLYNFLIDIPAETLLAAVLKRCAPEAFIEQAYRDLGGVIADDPAQIHHFLVFAENAFPKITPADLFEEKKLPLEELQTLLTHLNVDPSGHPQEVLQTLFRKLVDENLSVETDPIVAKNLTSLTKRGATLLLSAAGYLNHV